MLLVYASRTELFWININSAFAFLIIPHHWNGRVRRNTHIINNKDLLILHFQCHCCRCQGHIMGLGRFKKAYELLNIRALKFSPVDKMYIYQWMGKIFCVEFQTFLIHRKCVVSVDKVINKEWFWVTSFFTKVLMVLRSLFSETRQSPLR